MLHQKRRKAQQNNLAVVLLGWFFAFQNPWGEGPAKILQIIGPFASKAACKIELDKAKAAMQQMGMDPEVQDCIYKQEA